MVWLLLYNLDANDAFVDQRHVVSPFTSIGAALVYAEAFNEPPPRTHYQITGDDYQLLTKGFVYA